MWRCFFSIAIGFYFVPPIEQIIPDRPIVIEIIIIIAIGIRICIRIRIRIRIRIPSSDGDGDGFFPNVNTQGQNQKW